MSSLYRDDTSQATSVGRALENNVAFTTNNPYYKLISDEIVNRTAELSARRGVSRASAKYAALTVALEAHESQTLVEHFPEFNLVNYGSGRPGHAWWVQFRRLANEWMMLQAKEYGSKVAHLGGSVLSYLLSDFDDAFILADPTSASAAQDRHAGNQEVYRLFQNYAKVASDMALVDIRSKYEAYLRKEKFRTVMAPAEVPEVQVLCVDCSVYAYSPLQVASMMMQSGALITFGCFVYNAQMLLSDDGEIPGTGVHYQRTNSGMALRYPEGQQGVLRYPKGVWESWLTSQVFPVGVGAAAKWYQLELLMERSHLMFFRMTALPSRPDSLEVHHALTIPGAQDKYLMNSWELKHPGDDPTVADSWTNAPFLVATRLVDRVYQFAMQLDKASFTRYAIRKQIHVVNDRVTIEGTSVVVNSPLGIKMVDALVTGLFSRAFVDRYESGSLTKEMTDVVNQLSGFSTTSYLMRTWMIARVCLVTVWDYTLSYPNEAVRKFSDWVRMIMSRSVAKLAPQIHLLPPYLLLSDCAGAWVGKPSDEKLVSLARQQLYHAAVNESGFAAVWADAFSRLSASVLPDVPLELHRFRVEQVRLHSPEPESATEAARSFVRDVRVLNPIAEESSDRFSLEVSAAVRQVRAGARVNFEPDADPVYTLNEFYAKVCPGVALQNLEYDTASISLDPQDRNLAAPYLRLPKYFGEAPKPRNLFHSRLSALNVPKRQGTLQELLSSMAARNLNAPQVSLPQDDLAVARIVWDNFLDTACVPGARDMLKRFQSEQVELTESALLDWAAQATPDKLSMARQELETRSQALAEMPVGEYVAMLKSDVKPTLSTKPLESRTEPQVIVYHEKALSALYSSMFRMLVRRFMSLLKPNIHVNLLKDMVDIESFVRSVHPYGTKVSYLENDFSKYDKSQGRFVFILEELVFRELGLNSEMLERWVDGHVECSIRSVALGLSLHVMYQRKSGDATTAFGNVLLNILSVKYAYQGTDIAWALFMGDDSLVCARSVGCTENAAIVLSEVFNLGAKTYLTGEPYYASHFLLVDNVNEDVAFVADPVKRVERWSMMVSADDPMWHERFVSAADSLKTYMYGVNSVALAKAISARYPIAVEQVGDLVSAVATLVSDETKFRTIWEDAPQVSNY